MAVTHIVIFTWVAGTDSAQVERVRQGLDDLAEEFAGMMSIMHGPDLRFREGNGDYALVATFSNRADWDSYQAHPAHKAFVRDAIAPIQASRLAIQF